MPDKVECPHCGQRVDRGVFCGNCGRPLAADPIAAAQPIAAVSGSSTQTGAEADGLGTADASSRRSSGTRIGAWRDRLRPAGLVGALFPPLSPRRREHYRLAAGIGLGLVLLSLLAGSAGVAIAIAVCIVPTLYIMYFTDVDLYETEPLPVLLATVLVGFAGGVVLSALNAWLIGWLWLKHAVFNVGSAGFGGHVAVQAGFPPLSVLVVSGLGIPILAELAKIAGPYTLRRWPVFRNEVMDGITFGAASGAGFAAASTTVYYWPLITDRHSDGGALSDWTATLLGLLVARPLILSTTTALLCAGIWHFDLTQRTTDLVIPVVAGLGGAIVYAMGGLMVEPSGSRAELAWNVVVLIGLVLVLRLVLKRALVQDRRALGTGGNRVVCPTCRKLTPIGDFCAVCGAPLAATTTADRPIEQVAAEESRTTASTDGAMTS